MATPLRPPATADASPVAFQHFLRPQGAPSLAQDDVFVQVATMYVILQLKRPSPPVNLKLDADQILLLTLSEFFPNFTQFFTIDNFLIFW